MSSSGSGLPLMKNLAMQRPGCASVPKDRSRLRGGRYRCAPDFRWALAALSRYKRLTCSELVEVEVSADAAAVRYPWLQTTSEVPRVLVDTVMVSLRELAREGTAGRVAPVRRLAGRLVIRTKRSLRLAGAW